MNEDLKLSISFDNYLYLLHLDYKGVLLWTNEPVGVKTVHTDKLLEVKVASKLGLKERLGWQELIKVGNDPNHLEPKPSVISTVRCSYNSYIQRSNPNPYHPYHI